MKFSGEGMQLIIEKMGDNAVDLKDYNDRVDGVISRVNGVSLVLKLNCSA